jgi:hypothetical protein
MKSATLTSFGSGAPDLTAQSTTRAALTAALRTMTDHLSRSRKNGKA